MTPLQKILAAYRATSQTERKKGTYFEELIRTYFRFEPSYADLYSDVWLFADWAKAHGFSAKDTGIDLVAKTHGTEEFHAIQCKCYAEDYRVRKADIDSFFTASGQKPFTQRIIVTTTNDWSENAENSLVGQTPPVYKIDLQALEDSQIDWAKYQPTSAPALKEKKELRKHQGSAKTNVLLGFKSADRGKLIMACGTGKTFTSLKIAEDVAGPGKITLFLVPSLNLLSQTLTEWTQESAIPLHSFAVCSDAEVGKKRSKDEDIVETFAHELRYPATTDAKRLAHELKKRHDAQHMSVIFSTYHSLDVISRAQHLYGLPEIDLVICDEAHRTTGATFESDLESNFVRIHDNEFIRAAKRLYMTATPRIYADSAKATAEKDNVAICSMDDETLYGKQFHVITFSEAVELKLLTDYKVLVLTIDAAHVSSRIQDLLKDGNNQLKVDDAARIIGCWKALAKQGLADDLSHDPEPMKRAVAFCQVIERHKGGKVHKVSSKQISSMFSAVVNAYQDQEDSDNHLLCEAAHVDGAMNAAEKEEKLNWLKAAIPENTCRILSNVRCLSEGVDVPALDAVLFLTPRNSQVDVVQSVGRVMRRTPDGKKKLGYNADKTELEVSMKQMIAFYNSEVDRFNKAHIGMDRNAREARIDGFICTDPTKISWTRALKQDLEKGRRFDFEEGCLTRSLYRPFMKQWQYFNRRFNEMVYQMPRFFPDSNSKNVMIGVSASESRSVFSVFISDHVASLHAVDMVGSQYFPLYLYDKPDEATDDGDLFASAAPLKNGYTRRDAITDAGLSHFQSAYPAKGEGEKITKEDLFYYIYGLLHSPDYRSRYADNLGKELPRIPAVKTFKDFMAFSQAGRELAHWHLNYETVECHPGVTVEEAQSATVTDRRYRVTKMKFAKKKDPETGKSIHDKSTVIYNDYITLKNIPLEAYDYIVNGKPALEWVMERQSVTTDKDSGITNDANLWATETMNNPKYPLELFLRVVTVSLETNRIVAGLPELEIG
jgi:predicted helicase